MVSLIQNVIIMSLCGSILTFIILAVKPVTKKYFSAGWHYYIWTVVLAVFALPVHVAGEKLYDMARAAFPHLAGGIPHIENIIPNTTMLITGQIYGITQDGIMPGEHGGERVSSFLSAFTGDRAGADAFARIIAIALCALWVTGVAFIIVRKILNYRAFRRMLARHSQPFALHETPLPALKTGVHRESEELCGLIPGRLEIRCTSLLEAPLIIGLVRPVLYLPFSVEAERLNLILKHELTHYYRHDILYKWCTMIALAIHWFNPVIRIVSEQIDEECEISCDYIATRDLEPEDKVCYMRLILDMLSHSDRRRKIPTTQMSGSGKMLKRRFEMIKNPAETNGKRKTISIVVACALIIVTLFAGTVLAKSIGSDETGAGNAEGNDETASLTDSEGTDDNIYVLTPSDKTVAFVWQWPVPSSQEISSGYQVRTNPATGEELYHYGIDIKAESGEDVVSAMKGTVVSAEYDRVYGNCVRIAITLNDVEIETLYAHLSESTCEVGDEVMPGDVIGKIGSTGASTGPHLHFQIMNDGEYVDPLTYFPVDLETE